MKGFCSVIKDAVERQDTWMKESRGMLGDLPSHILADGTVLPGTTCVNLQTDSDVYGDMIEAATVLDVSLEKVAGVGEACAHMHGRVDVTGKVLEALTEPCPEVDHGLVENEVSGEEASLDDVEHDGGDAEEDDDECPEANDKQHEARFGDKTVKVCKAHSTDLRHVELCLRMLLILLWCRSQGGD
jgi:hypothetical protein